jgi:hypothetical protein
MAVLVLIFAGVMFGRIQTKHSNRSNAATKVTVQPKSSGDDSDHIGGIHLGLNLTTKNYAGGRSCPEITYRIPTEKEAHDFWLKKGQEALEECREQNYKHVLDLLYAVTEYCQPKEISEKLTLREIWVYALRNDYQCCLNYDYSHADLMRKDMKSHGIKFEEIAPGFSSKKLRVFEQLKKQQDNSISSYQGKTYNSKGKRLIRENLRIIRLNKLKVNAAPPTPGNSPNEIAKHY